MRKIRTKGKLIYGVGVNDADYCTKPTVYGKQIICKYYSTWYSMLQRCYSNKIHLKYPTYADCVVCEEWLTFSNFKKWMMLQDWEGKCLDKDILIQGNKIYSPDTCIFVNNSINLLFTKSDVARGQYKLGVYFNKENGKFRAQCTVNSKKKFLGCFLTEEEAYQAYKIFKQTHIRSIALEQSDERLKQAMLNYVVD